MLGSRRTERPPRFAPAAADLKNIGALRGAGFRLGRRRRGDLLADLARRTVDAVAQLLAGAEEDPALRLDRDHLSGLGVTPVVSLVIFDVECAEAADFDVVALAQGRLHRFEDRLDGELGLLLGQLALGHQDGDQIALEHSCNSARVGGRKRSTDRNVTRTCGLRASVPRSEAQAGFCAPLPTPSAGEGVECWTGATGMPSPQRFRKDSTDSPRAASAAPSACARVRETASVTWSACCAGYRRLARAAARTC